MRKNLLFFFAIIFLLSFKTANAQTLYIDTAQIGYFWNPGANVIGLDDIQVPVAGLGTFDTINITKVKFGIYRAASAPAVTVKLYYCLVSDTSTSAATAPVTPPVQIASFNLNANGSSNIYQTLIAGDSVNTLFSVPKLLNDPYNGSQTFFLGISFSRTAGSNSPNNGWFFASTDNYTNADRVWIYSGATLGSGNFGGTPLAGFNSQVFGYTTTALPVHFISFDGVLQNNQAVLNWSTASEINNKGFDVERSADGQNFSSIGFVPGNGTTTKISNYSYSDPKLVSGNNYYRLKQIDLDGNYNYSSVIKLEFSNLAWNILGNPSTNSSVQLQLDRQHNVAVQVVSIAGNVIQTINKGNLGQGTYSIPLDLSHAASGMYIVRMIIDGQSSSKNIVK